MPIHKQDLIELFQAADLNPEQQNIKAFLESYIYPIDEEAYWKGEAETLFEEDLFKIFKENNRAVYFKKQFYASLDEIRAALETVLQPFGEKLIFDQDDVELISNQGMGFSTQEMISEKLLQMNFQLVEFSTEENEEGIPFGGVIFRKDKFDSISENEGAWFLVHHYKKSEATSEDDFELWLQNPDLTEAEAMNAVTREDIKKLILAAEIDLSAEDVSKYLSLLENQKDYKINSKFIDSLYDLFERHNRIVWSDWKSYPDEFLENFNKVLADFGAEFTLSEKEIQQWERFLDEWTYDLINDKLSKQNLKAVMLQTDSDYYEWVIFRKDKLSLIEDKNLNSLLSLDWF